MRKKGILFMFFLFSAALHAQTSSVALQSPAIRAITRPSADVMLSFVQPGHVAKILRKDGARVRAGEMLVQLDDTVEKIALAQIEAASLDTTQIQASQASLDQKRLDLKKLEKAALLKAVTELEVEHARLDVTIADLALKMAVFEHEQAILKFQETKERLTRMRMVSPVDGIVEQVAIEAGESINALEPVMRVVQIDPLWIDASVTLSEATVLKKGQTVKVVFSAPNPQTVDGRVTYVSAMADAGSGTLVVRIEVPNKSLRPAGEHVRVICSLPQ